MLQVPETRHSPDFGGGHVLDSQVIAALHELGGDDDPELLDELIGLFLEDAERRLQVLSAAMREGDTEGMRRVAHALKSAAANLGAAPFSEACRMLEEAARNSEPLDLRAHAVTGMYPEVANALEDLRAR